MEDKEELTRAVNALRREVEELKQVVSALVEMVMEDDYVDDSPMTREDIVKLVPDHQNIYN